MSGFSKEAKLQIAWRDVDDRKGWPCCVCCHRPAPAFAAWSDFFLLPPEDGGKPVPENGLTLCPECRDRYKNGPNKDTMAIFLQNYLQWRCKQC